MANINYVPPKSLVPFFTSEKFVSLVVGPVGCVSADTEFLTPHGWKRIDKYRKGDVVAQIDPVYHRMAYVLPARYIKEPCEYMLHITGDSGVDEILSPEHRVMRGTPDGKRYREVLAKDMVNDMWENGSTYIIPTSFRGPTAVAVPLEDEELNHAIDQIIASYTLIPSFEPKWSHRPAGWRMKERIPEWSREAKILKISDLFQCREDQLRLVMARFRHYFPYKRKELSAIIDVKDPELLGFLQYCCAATCHKYTVEPQGRGVFRMFIGLSQSARAHIGGKYGYDVKCHTTTDGYKYCFEVPSGCLLLRRNNHVFVTGNSTKTTAGIMKIAYHAKRMAPCADGIRRSKAVWIRNTREQLRDTSIPDFLGWFPDGVAGDYAKTNNEFTLRFDDVECKVMFRGLDDARDVRRLLSLQVSFAIMDEFREINEEIFKTVQGRLGRYPNKMQVPPRPEWGNDENGMPIGGCVTDDGKPNAHIWGMSNPPDMETFWEEFLSDPPDNCHVTIQPSGMSPKADWIEFLPADYYSNLAEGKDQDWIDVYIHSKFGKSLAGMPVFRSFSRDMHVSKEPLSYIKSNTSPIIIGMDAALHPAAIFGQVDYKGRLLVLDEAYAVGMGASKFIREKVKPVLATRFPGQPVIVVIDPAANTRAQTDERTVLDIIRSEGIPVRMASTNSIQARISAVDANLTRIVDGEPWMLIDGARCPSLIAALAGKYKYRRKTDGNTEDKPDKTHPWSDLSDALQYLCLHTDTSGVYNQMNNDKAVPVQKVAYRYL